MSVMQPSYQNGYATEKQCRQLDETVWVLVQHVFYLFLPNANKMASSQGASVPNTAPEKPLIG